MPFADIIANLHNYDEAPFDGQAPSIYVADPWAPASQALVEWSGAKGGIPSDGTRCSRTHSLRGTVPLETNPPPRHTKTMFD
jgi:hypothetical protein